MKKSVSIIIGVGLLIVGIALGFGVSTVVNKKSSKHIGQGGMGKMVASGGAIGESEDGRPQRPDFDSDSSSDKKGTPPDMKGDSSDGNSRPQGRPDGKGGPGGNSESSTENSSESATSDAGTDNSSDSSI